MEISKEIWKDIISGKENFEFESLSLKILLSKLKLKYKIRSEDIDSYLNELNLLFKIQNALPGLQRDIEKIKTRLCINNKRSLFSLEEVKELINKGKSLLIAGDETLIAQLPQGNWIAGTIPYFMGEHGGVTTNDLIFVNILPDYIKEFKIEEYTTDSIKNIYNDSYKNGFSVIIIPSTSDIHFKFAIEAPNFENFATTPLIGWISGSLTEDILTKKAKVAFGNNTKISEKSAAVMHVNLPDDYYADLSIINIFEPGDGDVLMFSKDGFSFENITINGKSESFVSYLVYNNIDIKLPLVADYSGASINTSFQSIDLENNIVNLYAPVFKDVQYKIAKPIDNYVQAFNSRINNVRTENIAFSCNCILNYKYGELEGKKIEGITCPITFGEIAYQLLNQTFAYLSIIKHSKK